MTAFRFKFIFKLRLEEFLALVLLIPMLFFMIIYYDKEGLESIVAFDYWTNFFFLGYQAQNLNIY